MKIDLASFGVVIQNLRDFWAFLVVIGDISGHLLSILHIRGDSE